MRKPGLVLIAFGLSLLALAFWGLRRDVGWIAQPFYAWAWWGYIFSLDGISLAKRGRSLLTTRRRLLAPIAIGSITFWFFFELLNLRFQNWYYVGVFPIRSDLELLGGGVFTVLCFATVFIGIFETAECLAALGLFRGWKGRAGKLSRRASYAVQAVGVALASVAILFPHYLAPLIWGSFTLIVDPWNYRHGARSILRDIEHRDWGGIARLFVAGLICGLVWESFNFFAPQKWIYTVRGLEGFKLFEMPLLGFLGFPALAYDAVAGYALLSRLFLGNRPWEDPADLAYRLEPYPSRRGLFWATVPAQLLFWALVSVLMVGVNLGSVEVELADLPLSAAEREGLADLGIERPRQLLRAARDARRDELVRRLGGSGSRLERLADRAELYTFKGIGSRFGALLEKVGVRSVEDLRDWSVEELHARLVEEASAGDERAPRLDMVRVWVLASRSPGIVLREEDAREPHAGPPVGGQ